MPHGAYRIHMRGAERVRRAGSFGGVAQAYERSRPGYPDDAVTWLTSLPTGAVAAARPSGGRARVLDLGAGTGKLTRSLVAAGHDVVAVEPSGPMLELLRAGLPSVETHEGTAEAIPVDDASCDVVIVAQAFHWFDSAAAVPEIARVLRPAGRLALVWNLRDVSVPWVREFWSVIAPDEPRTVVSADLPDGSPFGPWDRADFTFTQAVDRDAAMELALSRSYVASASPERREALLDRAGWVFDAHTSGIADIRYTTYCFRAERLARRSSRVILLDAEFRTLLFKYVPADWPSAWVTPGGGLRPGETLAAGAARELFEEVGLRVEPEQLGSPVAYTTGYADKGWTSGPFRDDLFVYQAPSVNVSTAGMEPTEASQLADVRWWSADEIDAATDLILPLGLAELVRRVAAGDRPSSPIELPWRN